MPRYYLDFEKPLMELEEEIAHLRELAATTRRNCQPKLRRLEEELHKLRQETFSNLTPWQRIQLARHPDRPYTTDYLNQMLDGFIELHGDRRFGDDRAIIGGLCKLGNFSLMLIGHQKGRDTKSKLIHNFGMAHPEGYRKSLRLMKLAEKFSRPIVTLIDTPGAYPGVGAEERGQSQAIAENLREMFLVKVPIVSVVIGEGGSGGALALGVADRLLILENSVYSVISPEACAAILWRDNSKAKEAAEPLRLTALDTKSLGVADEIIPEPSGGAHRDYSGMCAILREAILRNLAALQDFSVEELLKMRYNKYRSIGSFKRGGGNS